MNLSLQEFEEFRNEAFELIDLAEQSLLAIESGEAQQLHYDPIFRAFHSLKGASGMIEFHSLQELMHVVEERLVHLKLEPKWEKADLEKFLRSLDEARILLEAAYRELQSPSPGPEEVPVAVASSPIIDVVSRESLPAPIEALQDFLFECDERLALATQVLDRARRSENLTSTDVDAVYRDVHTLKGAAGLFQFSNMEKLCHELETTLDHVRSQTTPLTAELALNLISTLDTVSLMVEKIRKNESDAVNPQPIVPDAPEVFPTVAIAQAAAEAPAVLEMENHMTESPPASNGDDDHGKTPRAPVAETSSVRIAVSLLDSMMALMGELVLVRNQVLQYANTNDDLNFNNLSKRLSGVTSELQNEVMKTRMQPISTILGKFQRVVRDLARDLNKNIELEIVGGETELDRTLIENVKDPLMHLLRNSCDHGIETREERRQAGKPETGSVTLKAYHEGGHVVVETTDDGRGIDRERILAHAVKKGLITQQQGRSFTEREVFDLIFKPGFSTASNVTNVSGRGVGMDVVKSNIEKIGGTVEIESRPGMSSTFRLRIPLTLAIVPAMIVVCEGERYAIPQVKLQELVRTDQAISERAIEMLQGQPVIRLRGEILPLVFLSKTLGLPDSAIPETAPVVVVATGALRFGLIVNEIQDTADIVVKPMPSYLKSLASYSGATVMGDGSVTCILDLDGIAKAAKLEEVVQVQSKDARQAITDNWNEMQDYLVFKVGDQQTHFATILNLVNRIEEFPASHLEWTGDTPVLRYRGGILPIFSLAKLLNLSGNDFESDVLRVIVTQRRGRTIGLIVSEILDVLSTSEEPDTSTIDRPGIMGNLVQRERVVVIADILFLLEVALKSITPPGEIAEVGYKTTASGKGKRILVIEDSPLFRKRIAGSLMAAGYEVETAIDGLDGFKKFQNASWFAIVSDIEMPRLTGWELAEKIIASGRLGSTRLIAVTSRDDEKSRAKSFSVGFHHFLPKFDSDQLIYHIELPTAQAKDVA